MLFQKYCLLLFISLCSFTDLSAQEIIFPLVSKEKKVSICYDSYDAPLDSIAANLLADDIERVSSYRPKVLTDLHSASGDIILIGSIQSPAIRKITGNHSALVQQLKGKWECFGYHFYNKPMPGISKILLIAGSDVRGTAYGVFTLSEKIGVSPWYWWADVPVQHQSHLSVAVAPYISSEPSVKYRGIFINDEDWGLRPWAADHDSTKNIGPATYQKVFELLLRLKANFLWPAMHPGTKPFFSNEENSRLASLYSIVIGSSHAEPMLRNNVGEWNESAMGPFNYITNQKKVYQYWEERVEQTKNEEVVYSLGMRGIHDSGMEGVKDAKEAVPLLTRIISDQRALLKKYRSEAIEQVPQIFTAYKEVLDIYDQGLKLPDDVTMVWPDDNYGYLLRLNDEKEKSRIGSAGVYYHVSYWGRPHDYLWLGTTHPLLIREEMMKALEAGASRLWVVNAGDIKPMEYELQFFLDMAYESSPFVKSSYAKQHLAWWMKKIFGAQYGSQIAGIMWKYYGLAFERRPEFMGWSQTEPTTSVRYSDYNHFYFGDEAQRRMDRYESLQKAVVSLRKKISPEVSEAFYELVYYPVVCAALMNKKFLSRDKALIHARQNRMAAYDDVRNSKDAYQNIIRETNDYNEALKNGKWKGMMSMKPRDLPVFLSPEFSPVDIDRSEKWNAIPEGYDTTDQKKGKEKILPEFTSGLDQHYFIDLFLCDSIKISWKAKVSEPWLILSQNDGKLDPEKNSIRLWVKVDWRKFHLTQSSKAWIEFSAVGKKIRITASATRPHLKDYESFKGIVENNGIISFQAGDFIKKTKATTEWELMEGTDSAALMIARSSSFISDTAQVRKNAASLSYSFFSFSSSQPSVSVFTWPTHAVNKNFGLRYALSVDHGPIIVTDFQTSGRSEEWKQNVLSNYAIRTISISPLRPGRHVLNIYALDPGVVLDRILISFGKVPAAYGRISETRKR
ncbi:MAG: glycosyl hydrolase 115 family protein [Flavisolibacter sp.]